MSRYAVTTTIPYGNGKPHVGHAPELVETYVLARHRRQRAQERSGRRGRGHLPCRVRRASLNASSRCGRSSACPTLIARANEDLVNNIGNLVNRTVSMVQRYRQGVIPGFAANDRALADFDFRRAAEAVMRIGDEGNRYVEAVRPWELAKAERRGRDSHNTRQPDASRPSMADHQVVRVTTENDRPDQMQVQDTSRSGCWPPGRTHTPSKCRAPEP
jgi:methionyl-tRNA synthetase